MKRIGLTGMSGSGKSYVCHIFNHYGIPSVNSDEIVHALYSRPNACTNELAALFGSTVLSHDGSINRRALADLVFSDPNKLMLLNRTVHPYVIKEIDALAKAEEEKGTAAFLIEAPQLFEAGLDKTCDYIISVVADHETKVERIARRDGISTQRAEMRLANQHTDDFFRLHAHFCIDNTKEDTLEEQIRVILCKIGLLS